MEACAEVKDMKYMVLGVLLVALFMIPAAVSAAQQGTGQVAVSGKIQPTCSITVNPGSLGFGNMQTGKTYYSTSGTVHVSCNIQPWVVVATDDSSAGKPAGYLWNATDSIHMIQPFNIYNGAGWTTLLAPYSFATGTVVGGFDFPVQFSQQVVEADVPDTYSTTVTFTLSA
jgi:hypothetical protein